MTLTSYILEAQVRVVCHRTRLLRILLKKEPNVPLLVIWTNQQKALPPDETVKSAVKHKTVAHLLLLAMC